MQLSAILLLLSAAISASAYPTAVPDYTFLDPRDAAEADTTSGPESADFACNYADGILSHQIDEIGKLKTQNISIPPYLAGYYSALSSGRDAIGCPTVLPVRKRFTPLAEPCDVIDEQHGRMMVLIQGFQSKNIGVAPFLAGFLSATLDGNKGFGCPPFAQTAADEAVANEADGEGSDDASA